MKDSITQAHRRISGSIKRTPCPRSAALSREVGGDVFLKLENQQLSGSFKLRGIFNKLLSLSKEEASSKLIAASTGNHGAAFAHAARELGLHGTLFLPRTATEKKLEAIKRSGIPFELVGDDCVETELHASTFARENHCVLVPPYNDAEVVAGQGTIAVELVEQLGELDAVLAPVGGGGMIAGIGAYLKALDPSVEVIGCQPENSAVMYHSIEAGEIVSEQCLPTLSDATAGGIEPGSITFDLCRTYVDRYVLVSEDEIAGAIRFIYEHEHQAIEGGAALSVAGAIKGRHQLAGKRVALVISGSKIDDEVLQRILG